MDWYCFCSKAKKTLIPPRPNSSNAGAKCENFKRGIHSGPSVLLVQPQDDDSGICRAGAGALPNAPELTPSSSLSCLERRCVAGQPKESHAEG